MAERAGREMGFPYSETNFCLPVLTIPADCESRHDATAMHAPFLVLHSKPPKDTNKVRLAGEIR